MYRMCYVYKLLNNLHRRLPELNAAAACFSSVLQWLISHRESLWHCLNQWLMSLIQSESLAVIESRILLLNYLRALELISLMATDVNKRVVRRYWWGSFVKDEMSLIWGTKFKKVLYYNLYEIFFYEQWFLWAVQVGARARSPSKISGSEWYFAMTKWIFLPFG